MRRVTRQARGLQEGGRGRVRAQTDAQAPAGLLQLAQGSYTAAGGPGWGAHKQLGARQGARGGRGLE